MHSMWMEIPDEDLGQEMMGYCPRCAAVNEFSLEELTYFYQEILRRIQTTKRINRVTCRNCGWRMDLETGMKWVLSG